MALKSQNKLQDLENQTFPNELSLFDAVAKTGVVKLGNYRSGGHNKKVARKDVLRYLDYKKTQEIDPNYPSKRACTVIEVYSLPLAKEENRGRRGRYIDYLRPLIIYTGEFKGRKAELFGNWGIYERYRQLDLTTASTIPSNPWRVLENMPIGVSTYKRIINFIENKSLETALDSLQSEHIIDWEKRLMYLPPIITEDYVSSIPRMRTEEELDQEYQRKYDLVVSYSKKENCVLSLELYKESWEIPSQYRTWVKECQVDHGLPQPQIATESQMQLYENYKQFLRQVVYSKCNNLEAYCPVEEIPNAYHFFQNTQYAFCYFREEKKLKDLLWWKSAWYEYEFHVIDERAAAKYQVDDICELAEGLRTEYILYMNSHLNRTIPFDQKDYMGIGKPPQFKLKDSRSAMALHQKLMSIVKREDPPGDDVA